MLDYKTHLKTREAKVRPAKIIVKVSDSADFDLIVTLPPAEEIKSSIFTSEPKISVKELENCDPFNLTEGYKSEINSLREKYERFRTSPTFLTHLANLSELSGRFAEAENFLKEAVSLNNKPFLRHELGAILIEQNCDVEAMSIFETCDLKNDTRANLRIAQIYAQDNDLNSAEKYVQKAIEIDNTDYAARMFEGALCLWKKDWEKAVRSFRVAAEEKNSSSALYVNLAAAYWGLGEEEKTVLALKRATFIDPLNIDAVLFLSDVMFLRNTSEECISPLETILAYEQTNGALWARAARAYYQSGVNQDNNMLLSKSIDALNNQLAINKSPEILNNIGVVYSAKHKNHQAKYYYSRAITEAENLNQNYELPLSNLLGSLIESKDFKTVFRLSDEYLASQEFDNEDLSGLLPRIYVQHLVSLEALGKRREAAEKAEELFNRGVGDVEIKVELLTHIFFYRTLYEPDFEIIKKYLPDIQNLLNHPQELPEALHIRALNNTIFSLLIFDELDRARSCIGQLSRWVHSDPYATATYGLFHLKKGNLDKASDLYNESISMLDDRVMKKKIRQRMNLEFGKKYLEIGNIKKAVQYIEKAKSQNFGNSYATKEAQKLLLALPRNNGNLE